MGVRGEASKCGRSEGLGVSGWGRISGGRGQESRWWGLRVVGSSM